MNARSKYLITFLDFLDDFLDDLLEDSKYLLQLIMGGSNLIKIVITLVTAGLFMACSFQYYRKNKNDIKTNNKNNNCSLPKEFINSTISTDDILTETSRTSSQEKIEKYESIAKVTDTPLTPFQGESDAIIRPSQVSCQDDPITQDSSQEFDDNPLANDTIVLTHKTASQATSHKVIIKADVHEPEAGVQSKSHEEIPENQPKTDPIIVQTISNHTAMPKAESESEVSSHSDLSNIGDENTNSTPVETISPKEDESQGSRSIILNDQIPVKTPLPNETALEILNEFRSSNVVHAFTGQDLIELEDYDEAAEIRFFLLKRYLDGIK